MTKLLEDNLIETKDELFVKRSKTNDNDKLQAQF